MEDSQLLHEYVEHHSEAAFARVVHRHMGMVYAACRRQVRDAHLAEDVAQAVFMILSRRARSIRPGTILAGWLYQVARYAAANANRIEANRRIHERQAARMAQDGSYSAAETEARWDVLEVYVDDALSKLPRRDRDALLLRYFQGQPIADVASALSVSEEAARKRINRALDRMRILLSGRVSVASGGVLHCVLAANAAQSAPASLVHATCAAVGPGASATAPAATIAIADRVARLMAWAHVKVALACMLVAALAAAAGTAAVSTSGPASTSPALRTPVGIPTRARNTAQSDDDMVQSALELDRWIQEERKAGRVRIDYDSAQVLRVEASVLRGAAVARLPNPENRETDTLRLGPSSEPVQPPKFYSLEGKPLVIDTERISADKVYYHVRLPQAIAPKADVRLILLVQRPPNDRYFWQEGKLWYVTVANDTANCLNYFRVILPPSAVLVDSTSPSTALQTINGQATVTFRNYTGPQGDGSVTVAFLWPDRDGNSMSDLPGQYRGLRDPEATQLAEEYRRRMNGIMSRADYYVDQTTPVGAWLTRNCALAYADEELLSGVVYQAQKDMAAWKKRIQAPGFWEGLRHGLDDVDLLTTAHWPEKPEEGHLHAIQVCAKGSLIRLDTYVMIYSKGKWWWMGNEGNPRRTDVTAFEKWK